MNQTGALFRYSRLPVVGQLAAGRSVEYLPIVKWRDVRLPTWARAADRFIVAEVCGDSLAGARIHDGDLALIHLTRDIKQGDLCAVSVFGAMLLKYVYLQDDGRVRLESRSAAHRPRIYDADTIDIQGKVIRIEFDL